MKKLEKRPFALIGVNLIDHSPAELKAVMTKEGLNWRSFAGGGGIAARWPVSGTPTFYLIDGKGVIRRKWVGAPGHKALDAAIENLLHEVEEAAR